MNWINKNIKLSEIKPYEANPRTITEKGLKDLRKSIENFGIADPIIINTDGTLIGGHARYLVLKEKGVENVSARVPDRKLTDKQVQELNIRLNKNIAGEWDFDGLANWFEEDELLEWGFEEWEVPVTSPNELAETEFDLSKKKLIKCPECGYEFSEK